MGDLGAPPEIAPKSSRNDQTEELALEGGGNPAVFGGWQRPYGGIRGGQWYRLQVRYQAKGLGFEPLQTPVRLDWTTANGERAGRPDYAWRVTEEGGWRLVNLDAPAPPRTVKIATVRLRPRGPDPVSAFVALVDAQVTDKTDIILLPEGITQVGTDQKFADLAEPVPGPTTGRLGELAKRKGAWIVAGVYERAGPVIYNTAVLINRDGKFAGKYRKIYTPRDELEGGITPGSECPVFDTDFGKIGMMIC